MISIIGIITVIYYIISFPEFSDECRYEDCVQCNGNYQITRLPPGNATDVDMHEESSNRNLHPVLFWKILDL